MNLEPHGRGLLSPTSCLTVLNTASLPFGVSYAEMLWETFLSLGTRAQARRDLPRTSVPDYPWPPTGPLWASNTKKSEQCMLVTGADPSLKDIKHFWQGQLRCPDPCRVWREQGHRTVVQKAQMPLWPLFYFELGHGRRCEGHSSSCRKGTIPEGFNNHKGHWRQRHRCKVAS